MEVLDISFKSISAKEARELYREEKSQSISEESLDFRKQPLAELVRRRLKVLFDELGSAAQRYRVENATLTPLA